MGHRLLKVLLAAAVAVALVAGAANAQSTPRGVRGASDGDQPPAQLLLESFVTTVDLTPECLVLYGGGVSILCDTLLLTEIIWPHNAFVSEIRIATKRIGDAGYQCDFTIEVAGVAASGQVTAVLPVDQAADTLTVFSQNLNIAEGDLVGIRVDDGTAGCDGTVDPQFQVGLYGFWTF